MLIFGGKVINHKNSLEVAFLRLSGDWLDEFGRLNSGPPSQETDLKALAAMLISVEQPQSLSSTCRERIHSCHELLQQRKRLWDDALPWTIAGDALNNILYTGSGIELLINNLNHGTSFLRLWTMEIAWLMREQIQVDKTSLKLFDNVASTLLYVEDAWGLVSSLFADSEEFYQEADNYKPREEYQDQYQDRLQLFKKQAPLNFQAYFWRLEAKCRKYIQEAVGGTKQAKLDL